MEAQKVHKRAKVKAKIRYNNIMSLTIIILTHNSQETIKQSLKSALFADEVIIIDGSNSQSAIDFKGNFEGSFRFDFKYIVIEAI